MDRRERAGEMLAGMLAFEEHVKAGLWTALPGIIQSFNPEARTCVVQPAIKMQEMAPDGSTRWVQLPLLLDCPVQFPGGGGCVLTFPLKEGDECLVVFASRCIDAWWQNGGIQAQAELRMHDLSDGYCVPGISSKPRVQEDISTTVASLRSDDGEARVTINPETKELRAQTSGIAHIVGGSDLFLQASTVRVVGILVVNGEPYLDHTHNGVQSGGSNTGGVNP